MSPPPASRGETTLTMIQTIDQLVSHAHDLFQQAFDLFHDSKHGIVASERETAGLRLRSLSETLQKDIAQQREVAASLNVTDIADVYVTAGYTKGEAVIKAKEDLEGLNRRVDTIEGRIKRMVAEVMYEK
jgi:Trp operon repressor